MAAHQPTQQRYPAVEVEAEERAQQRLADWRHLQNDQPPPAPQRPRHGREGLRQPVHVPQDEGADHRIHRPVGQRRSQRIAHDKPRALPVPDGSGPAPGDVQHRAREIEADDAGPGPTASNQRQRQVAGSRPHVQHQARLNGQGLANRDAPPAVVHPQADEAIEQVVARRNRVEHGPHPGGLVRWHGVRRGPRSADPSRR